jgi:two-component system, NarL family, invasion response regulator UvrY
MFNFVNSVIMFDNRVLNEETIKIIVADDHAVVRTGLQLIIGSTPGLTIAGEASNAGELLATLEVEEYDVVVLDMSMPGLDSLEALKEIKFRYPQLPVVIFTMNPDDQYAARMFSNGASAFINKELSPDILVQAIQAAYKGKRYFTPTQAGLFADQLAARSRGGQHQELTDRELQVLRLIAQGKTKDEMAKVLDISKNTISNHRVNILRKLNLHNTAEITRYALENKMI